MAATSPPTRLASNGPSPWPRSHSRFAGVVMLFHSSIERMKRTFPEPDDGEIDPKTASWEIALDGLTTLADECAFRGRFDQTRLAALQGRGEAEIVCPIADGVDRPYHTLYFETREPTPGTTLRVRVVYQRPGS